VLAVAPGRVLKPMYWVAVLLDSTAGINGYFDIPIQVKGASWQPLQLDVTPAWICAVVGAGVANRVPGAVIVATAATGPAGIEPRWQVSHAVLEGMCADAAPAGVVAGITAIFEMPVNEDPVIVGPWHSTQVATPWWLILEPENSAPFWTVVGTLEPAPTWHTSHDCAVGTCLIVAPAAVWAIVVILKFAAGIA
jgi:hypothetical protein